MKTFIVTALLFAGMSASAQSSCQVSEDITQRIEETKASNMMAKPKFSTIRALVATDSCVARYLQSGDDVQLARDIMNLDFIPSQQILSHFVKQAEEKSASQTCKASQETLDQVDFLRTSGMHVKVRYVSMKGALIEDECLASELSEGKIIELAQSLTFQSATFQSSEEIINQALAK